MPAAGMPAWWACDLDGASPPVRLLGLVPLAVTPHGLLGQTGHWRDPQRLWARPPSWDHELMVEDPIRFHVFRERARQGLVDPSGARLWLGKRLYSLPGLEPLSTGDQEVPRTAQIDWVGDRAAWAMGENVLSQPLGGGPAARWKPAEAWRRRHPAQAAGVGPGELGLTVLRDGRLATGEPLAVHDVVSGETWFPNRGDARHLTGTPRLSHDGEALLMFRGGLPCRVPLNGTLPPRPSPAVDPGIWHPQAACALVKPAPHSPAEVRDTHKRVLFRFPHGLRPVCWSPDGRGVILQRELGAGAGPLEVWRLPETT